MREETQLKKEIFELNKSFLEELEKETSRACAILGGAYIEDKLRQLLKARLVYNKTLFENVIDRVSVSQCIDLCFLLGLVPQDRGKVLRKINTIRGKFAHDIHLHSFDKMDITKKCNELAVLLNKMRPDIVENDFLKSSPRNQFIKSVAFFMGHLEACIVACKRLKLGEFFDKNKFDEISKKEDIG
jgi:hypothetical protein